LFYFFRTSVSFSFLLVFSPLLFLTL
jgi:hypothetical protein